MGRNQPGYATADIRQLPPDWYMLSHPLANVNSLMNIRWKVQKCKPGQII